VSQALAGSPFESVILAVLPSSCWEGLWEAGDVIAPAADALLPRWMMQHGLLVAHLSGTIKLLWGHFVVSSDNSQQIGLL